MAKIVKSSIAAKANAKTEESVKEEAVSETAKKPRTPRKAKKVIPSASLTRQPDGVETQATVVSPKQEVKSVGDVTNEMVECAAEKAETKNTKPEGTIIVCEDDDMVIVKQGNKTVIVIDDKWLSDPTELKMAIAEARKLCEAKGLSVKE